ncbi:MAG: NRDE family protein [Planctomycetes bacterium]|nr:NRDE family protein [Planctomycetota bacterium]
MCTLTWVRHGTGFELFFNRDEQRTRAKAKAPFVHERAGRRWIAPTDTAGGGTWIGVNEFGLAVALLNGFLRGDQGERPWTTRGELVESVLDAKNVREVEVRLRKRHLERFRSFTLVAVEPAAPALVASWDGQELALDQRFDGHPPICSSSLDPNGATRARRELFSELQARHGGIDSGLLELFHRSHGPERGALSPCMHRDDAATQSFTRIAVDAERVELHYTPGAPCEGLAAERLELPRQRS